MNERSEVRPLSPLLAGCRYYGQIMASSNPGVGQGIPSPPRPGDSRGAKATGGD
jgi:hypothetical protein